MVGESKLLKNLPDPAKTLFQEEIERLIEKVRIYGDKIVWKQNEFSEILPFPTPLSLSLLRKFAAHDGASGIACRDLKISYSSGIPVEDYIETIFGRTYVNSEAEKRITSVNSPLSFLTSLASKGKIKTENISFYEEFPEILTHLEDYFETENRNDLSKLKTGDIIRKTGEIVNSLNTHFAYVVKAGFLANYNLSDIVSRTTSQDAASLITADANPLIKGDRKAADILEFRKNSLHVFSRYEASVEYELACPRFFETGQTPAETKKAETKKSDISIPKANLKNSLKYFKVYESLKIILKSLLLRELSLLRRAVLHAGKISRYGDDIFYLTLDEIPEITNTDFKKIILHRKENRKVFKDMELSPLLTPEDLRKLATGRPEVRTHDLSGVPVIETETRGRAVIYNDDRDLERVSHDSVLVSKYALPNLVMAFPEAAGMITETGGLLSHLAIVAREQGFPLILQVQDATKLIKDGDLLLIDRKGKISIER
jgi:phosphohistidine swiveling domain-containing protein